MLKCRFRDPEGVCMINNSLCVGDKEKFCTWYADGKCKLTDYKCTCAAGCGKYINKTAVHDDIYIGVNYKAICYDPEYGKYSVVGGVAYGSCIEEALLNARRTEYENCLEFGMELKRVKLVSVITDLYTREVREYD